MLNSESLSKVMECLPAQELFNLTADLIRINTVWDPANGTSEQPAVDLVAAWAKREGLDFVIDEVAPGRPNLIITLKGSPGPRKLMFEGHTDVVSVGDVSAWKHDPFGAEVVDRRMYGRGTNDTKGNLAAMLMAIAAIKRSGVPFAGSIVGGVLCDEEDRMLGVLDFIRRGHADDVTGAIICEPEDNFICCTQKGALRARFTITGKMSHGAMPLAGLNPAPAISRIIEGLARLEAGEIKRHGKDELLGWPSVTPTVVLSPAHGPAQLNVVPSAAQIQVDIRTLPCQDHEELMMSLEDLARRVTEETNRYYDEYDRLIEHDRQHDLTVRVEILTDRPATLTDRKSPLVRAVHLAVAEISGREPVYSGVPGATDGTFLWSQKNIPIVTTGAGDQYVPHQVDEWVDLDQLHQTAGIYAASALAYLRLEDGEGK